MGFQKSSVNIQLKNGHVLTAYCPRSSGDAVYSELDLNEFLGTKKGKPHTIDDSYPSGLHLITCFPVDAFNIIQIWGLTYPHPIFETGKFAWGCGNFSQKASDANLQFEGPTNEPILHAQLDNDEGVRREECVNLAECIKNEEGHLRFMDCF